MMAVPRLQHGMPDGDGVSTEMEAGGMPHGDNAELANSGVNVKKSN